MNNPLMVLIGIDEHDCMNHFRSVIKNYDNIIIDISKIGNKRQ